MAKRKAGDESDSDYQPSSPEEGSEEAVPEYQQVIDQFVLFLRGYLAGSGARVREADRSGKGWEAWLHVELYLHIKAAAGANWVIRREPAARYPGQGRLRPDLLFNDADRPDPEDGLTIEIKADREGQTPKQFADGIAADADKLGKLGRGTAMVLGVTCVAASYEALKGVVEVRGAVPSGMVTAYYGYTCSEAADS